MIAKCPSNSGPGTFLLCRSGLVSLLVIAAVAFGAPAPASGQATAGSDSKYTRSPKNTYFIDCGAMPPYASHSARSPVLVSPDRKRSAFAQASARWVDGTCVNVSKVYVAERDRGYQAVFLQVPTETLLGNGVRLIDWSKDGGRLLFDVLRWQWGSDAPPSNEIWLYDAGTGIFNHLSLVQQILSFGEGCLVSVNPLGFSHNGEAAVGLSATSYVEPGETEQRPCDRRPEVWLFDPRTGQMHQTASDYSPPKWGKLASVR